MDTMMIDVGPLRNPLGKVVTVLGDVPGCTLVDYINITGETAARLLCSLKLAE
jgi:alanine racemase